jgi:hypothetical protein
MPFIGGVCVGTVAAAGAVAGIVCAAANVVSPAASATNAMRRTVVRVETSFDWVIFRSSRCFFGEIFLAH